MRQRLHEGEYPMNKYLNPINFWKKLVYYKDKVIYQPFYNLKKMRNIEIAKYKEYDFEYQQAVNKINRVLRDLGQDEYHLQKHMASVHWLLFAALSEAENIKNILEIGTFDGKTTLLLSKLFPKAKITTVDLPDDDPIFNNSYQREDEKYRRDFLIKQAENTSSQNINIIKKNSFFLNEVVDERFDLIWVDGGHLYPEISWDICNAYHLCNKNGWILYDDIIPEQKYGQGIECSDTYNVLEYIKQRMESKITYFLKRDAAKFSANPKKRKYVALMHKI